MYLCPTHTQSTLAGNIRTTTSTQTMCFHPLEEPQNFSRNFLATSSINMCLLAKRKNLRIEDFLTSCCGKSASRHRDQASPETLIPQRPFAQLWTQRRNWEEGPETGGGTPTKGSLEAGFSRKKFSPADTSSLDQGDLGQTSPTARTVEQFVLF